MCFDFHNFARMEKIERLSDFYNQLPAEADSAATGCPGAGHFNVFPRKYCVATASCHRRDFYKISLITVGTGIIHYNGRDLRIDRPALFFSNPEMVHTWEATSQQQEGWFCLFTEEFIQAWSQTVGMQDYQAFRIQDCPVIFLDDVSLKNFSGIYLKMMQAVASDYVYKFSELRNYLQLLIHEALKLRPEVCRRGQENASHRIAFSFLELLESQFPIENSDTPLKLRTVQEYAQCLNVHENHLNHTVKEVTTVSPSQHIARRITEEAKALLKNTDWPITAIADSLRFEYSSYFTNFFKKSTGVSPREFRRESV